MTDNSKDYCFQKHQLPCIDGHPLCYNISEICTYKLNGQHGIFPCRTGNHLQNCTEFECNMMFKCPGYYCIPWSYVCDGKWDCPGGYDEYKEHNCSGKRQCVNMFKCRLSNLCIHFGDICDGKQDCTKGDDEYLCLLNGQRCPVRCECLTFVIRCLAVKNSEHSFSTSPNFILQLKDCSRMFSESLLLGANKIVL